MNMLKKMKEEFRRPSLLVDGKPLFASYQWSVAPEPDKFVNDAAARKYAEAGIHLHTFDLGDDQWCGPNNHAIGKGAPAAHFDFSCLKERFNRVLDADPDARFSLRIHTEKYGADNWWLKMYPEESELAEGGGGGYSDSYASQLRSSQSYASVLWRDQAKAFLREYVRQIEAIGMAERVVAWHPMHGYAGECFKWSAVGDEIGDFSEPMQLYFRNWLKIRYDNDERGLRTAWADPNVNFGTAMVPTRAQQLQTHHMTFRDPRTEQQVIDYYRSYADLNADLIIDFNRTLKDEIPNGIFTGAFYGYLFELTGNDSFWGGGNETRLGGLQRSGQLGFRKVIESPYIDFIVTPYIYFFRGMGGECSPQQPVESTRIHGKIFILEDDTRTHLSDRNAMYGQLTNLDDSIAILKRNFSAALVRSLGIWWNPWIDPDREPAFGPLLADFQRLGTWSLQLENTPCAEIAVLLDDESLYYETIYNDLSLPNITQQRVWGLPRIGAPFDCYLLQDFIDGKVPSAKLCIFLNAFRLDDKRRKALSDELRKDGRTALWIYAPGYIKDDMSVDHMEELTGIQFGKSEFPWGPLIHITDFDHPITEKLNEELFWGTNTPLGPIFHVDDPEATVLGEVVYSEGRCDPGFALKSFPEWNSVYIAAPNIPAPVLRGIAKYAGVHLYSEDGDVLYANKQLLAVHTIRGGKRTLRLPESVEVVYDLFERKIIAENTDTLKVELPKRSTSLYFTGTSEILDSLE
jgi:hypothetical protein